MESAELRPMKLLKANYTNYNTWEPTLDYNLLKQTINKRIANFYTRSIQSEVI